MDVERWRRRGRAAGLELDPDGLRRLREEVLAPVVEEVVDRLRAWLEPLYAELPAFDHGALRERQVEYLRTLGAGWEREDYLASRARIGATHYRYGIPLEDYVLAHQHLLELILARVFAGVEAAAAPGLAACACRITGYDMAISSEAYRHALMDPLERNLASQASETRRFRVRATLDALTQLPNRAEIVHGLEAALTRAEERGRPLTVGMADLDHFKRVNDEHGHLTGDEVLSIAARRMLAALRTQQDRLGRYGGEEFLFFLPDTGVEAARGVAERLRLALSRAPCETRAGPVKVTVSLGLSEAAPGDSLQSVIERADEALYRAKHLGRDRVEVG